MKHFFKYTLEEEKEYHLPEYNGRNGRKIVRESDHKVLAEINNRGILHIYEGYSWDGCSPKYSLFGGNIVIGVWDGDKDDKTGEQKLKYPSLVHDVLCQMFHGHDDRKFYTRKDIDVIFRNKMKEYKVIYSIRVMYYYAVRAYAKVNGYV